MNRVTIYGLREPGTTEIRYVGQSRNPNVRAKQHVSGSTSIRVRVWTNELVTRDLKPELVVLEEVDEGAAAVAEQAWIRKLLDEGNRLLNVRGGEMPLPHPNHIDDAFEALRKVDPTNPRLGPYLRRRGHKRRLAVRVGPVLDAPMPPAGAPFPDRLRWARQLCGLSQQGLAALAGIALTSVAKIENRQQWKRIGVPNFGALADVFGVDLHWLWDGTVKVPTVESMRAAVARRVTHA